jgi:hypothetical protein
MRNILLLLPCASFFLSTVTARSYSYYDDRRFVSIGKWNIPGGESRPIAEGRLSAESGVGRSHHANEADESSGLLLANQEDEESSLLCAITTEGISQSRSIGPRSLRLGKPKPLLPETTGARIIQDESTATSASDANKEDEEIFMLKALTQPLIPQSVWDRLQGDELQRFPELLDGLSDTGELLARHDTSNEWIRWKVHGSGGGSLDNGDILVWTGTSLKDAYGVTVPWIKTRSILPLSAEDMVELLMDSDRVTTYNPWSLGRNDCWVAGREAGSLYQTKIVKNRVQPPMGAKAVASVTLLHARPVATDGAWLVISRATGGNLYPEPDQDSIGKSDILMGVNLLQPVDEDSCMLTAVTHAYSAAVPAMLAERLSVKGAITFIKDIRKLKAVPAN